MDRLIKPYPLPYLMICGIDEAGRGPVIGPIVIAGVKIDDDNVLRKLQVKDSKKHSPHRREVLFKQIVEVVDDYRVVYLKPSEIDEMRKRFTLNQIELRAFADLMKILCSDIYYVDAVDVDDERFGEELSKLLPFDAEIISEHKADERYPVVSAASIVAKVKRDAEIRKIAKELEPELGLPLGSGYPADPITQKFIGEWVDRFGSLPPHVRRSWKTAKRLLQRKL